MIRDAQFKDSAERISTKRHIFVSHDTTDLFFEDSKEHLYAHSSLAITDNKVPIGLVSQVTWTREEEFGKKEKRRKTPFEEKESGKWVLGLHGARKAVPINCHITHIMDREADVYDLFLYGCQLINDSFIVRASSNRAIQAEVGQLFSWIGAQPVAEVRKVTLPRNKRREERVGVLEIRFGKVAIKPPQYREKENLPDIVLNIVYAKEIEQPLGEEAVEWYLLTTMEVEAVEQAWRCIDSYKLRWLIEIYHFILKSGCKIENSQLDGIEKKDLLLSIYNPIACKILELTWRNRQDSRRGYEIIKKEDWELLWKYRYEKKEIPKGEPSAREVVREIAGLGGFMGRKGDGEPGVKAMWEGWKEWQLVLRGIELARAEKNLGKG